MHQTVVLLIDKEGRDGHVACLRGGHADRWVVGPIVDERHIGAVSTILNR
ncbi:MAG: hypothetical protein AAFY99_05880 [Pseudomonadota bacterium]